MTIDKNARQNRVLEAIIRVHTENALPVSSKHIAHMLNLSSATIRGVMFELEKEGYVSQPYTSAGRIPTDLGYRRYVDDIMSVREFPGDDVFLEVKRHINNKRFFEEVIEATSHAVSKVTNYTSLVLSPSNKLYFDGTYHMFEQPEFNEVSMARDFLKIIEEKNELMRLMGGDLESNGTVIHIGRENKYKELRKYTVITSAFSFKRRASGNIGIIGPMRMRYEEVVPVLETLAEITTEILEEISA